LQWSGLGPDDAVLECITAKHRKELKALMPTTEITLDHILDESTDCQLKGCYCHIIYTGFPN